MTDPYYTTGSAARRIGSVYGKAAGTNLAPTGTQHLTPDINGGRNPGDVWTIPTTPFAGAHFAVYPPELVRRCIVAGCKPGGTVLDPRLRRRCRMTDPLFPDVQPCGCETGAGHSCEPPF